MRIYIQIGLVVVFCFSVVSAFAANCYRGSQGTLVETVVVRDPMGNLWTLDKGTQVRVVDGEVSMRDPHSGVELYAWLELAAQTPATPKEVRDSKGTLVACAVEPGRIISGRTIDEALGTKYVINCYPN